MLVDVAGEGEKTETNERKQLRAAPLQLGEIGSAHFPSQFLSSRFFKLASAYIA